MITNLALFVKIYFLQFRQSYERIYVDLIRNNYPIKVIGGITNSFFFRKLVPFQYTNIVRALHTWNMKGKNAK